MLNKTIAAALAVTVGAVSFTGTAQADRWHRYHHGNDYHHGNGNAWAAGAVGFGAGALLGSALASPRYYAAPSYYEPAPYAYYQPAPVYAAPPAVVSYRAAPWSPEWYSYCQSRYRSFNPSTGYFAGYDGQYHFCN